MEVKHALRTISSFSSPGLRGLWVSQTEAPASGTSGAHSTCQREDALGQGRIRKTKINPWAKALGAELSDTDPEHENHCKFTSWLTASCEGKGPERYFSFWEGESQETIYLHSKSKETPLWVGEFH